MKKVCIYLLSFLTISVMLSGCKSDKGSTVQAPVLTADLSAATTDIGKPLDELLSLHTSYEYLHLAGYDFSDECFGAADGSFAFVFFGTQGGPSLKEMAADYAKQLKCAGIHTTVGKIFSGIGDAPVSAKNLLSSVGINNVGSDEVTLWNGWILFEYSGYSMAINTNTPDSASGEAQEISKIIINKGFPLIITDEELLSHNIKLCDEYTKKQLHL